MFSKKNFVSIALASTLALSAVVPANLAVAQTVTEGSVTAQSLTVRTGPSASYSAQAWLKKGDKVTVLKDHGDFVYIQYGNKKGYVHEKYLKLTSKTTANTVSSSKGNVGTVTATTLTVRKGPSANHGAIDWIKKGQQVSILEDHGTFVYVQYGSKKGYVHEGYLKRTTGTVSTPKPSTTPSSTPTTSTSGKVGTVTAATLTVRKGPSAQDAAIDWLKKGTKVTIIKDHGAFSYVEYNGKKGYVHDGYLKVTTTTTTTPNTNNNATPAPVKGDIHIVQKGETLWKISTMYKTTVANIQSLNNLHSTMIKVGQKLVVNGTASSTNPSKPTTSNPASNALKGKLIVLDPGHGGKYAGAQGFVHEEDVNLQIALKTRNELQRLGATVIMTRTTDSHLASVYNNDLAARPAVAKRNNAHMFISIHANAGSAAANGTEVYWYNTGRGDKKLASYLTNAISDESGLKNRGAKYGNFSVIRNSGNSIPSVLIETGFVSNQKDAGILGSASGQQNIAEGISKGVLKYYGK